jgi:hypothetical protein
VTGDEHVAILDQPLDVRSRVVGEDRHQKTIEPGAVDVIGDIDGVNRHRGSGGHAGR